MDGKKGAQIFLGESDSREVKLPPKIQERVKKAEQEIKKLKRLGREERVQEKMYIPPLGIDELEWKSSINVVISFFREDRIFIRDVIDFSKSIISYHFLGEASLNKILGCDYVNLYEASNELASAVCIMLMAYSKDVSEKTRNLYIKNKEGFLWS